MTASGKRSSSGSNAARDDGWQEVQAPPTRVWQPTSKGEMLTGRLMGIRTVVTKFGERTLMEVMDHDDRAIVTVWCPTRLRAKVEQVAEFPGPGCEVRIRYLGQEAPGKGGRAGAHNFALFVRGGKTPIE